MATKLTTNAFSQQVKIFSLVSTKTNTPESVEEAINDFLLQYPGAKLLHTNNSVMIVFSYMKEFNAKSTT